MAGLTGPAIDNRDYDYGCHYRRDGRHHRARLAN